jgi:hypothetical protein
MFSPSSNLERSSDLIGSRKKFPTTTFVARRLQEVGWGSPYSQVLIATFREDLIRECGESFFDVLERFRSAPF